MEIAAQLGMFPKKAARWRNRFLDVGLEKDAPSPAARLRVQITAALVQLVVEKTTQTKPANATHSSPRSLAAELGINDYRALRVWRARGLKPHLVETFKVSNDPQFAGEPEAIVGLYLSPPEHSVEKSHIQALDRTQPSPPLKRGRRETMTHDYKRNGTATLFPTLNAGNGKCSAFSWGNTYIRSGDVFSS